MQTNTNDLYHRTYDICHSKIFHISSIFPKIKQQLSVSNIQTYDHEDILHFVVFSPNKKKQTNSKSKTPTRIDPEEFLHPSNHPPKKKSPKGGIVEIFQLPTFPKPNVFSDISRFFVPSSWRFSPMARFGPWPPSPNCMSLVALSDQDFGSEVVGRPLVVSEFPSEFGPVGITEEGLVNGWFEVEIFPFFWGGLAGEDGRTRFFNGLSWVKNPFFCWCFFFVGKKCVALLLALVDDFFGGFWGDLACLFFWWWFFCVGSCFLK